MIFLVLTNFCLIFGVTVSMIYAQKVNDRQRQLDKYRHLLRHHYTITVFISSIVAAALVGLYIMPRFTIPLFYS